jgi:MEDS: MEthanogen/methylotroph, DcmR Sensory domain
LGYDENGMMSPWEKLLESPHSRGHFVQLYRAGESSLTENVSRYLWEGLRQGDGALIIADKDHFRAFSSRVEQLGIDIAKAIREQQVVFLDAQETLAKFMVRTEPDWNRFERTIRLAAKEVQPKTDEAGLRAYGEMVGILWRARQFSAAIRLEQFWNKLLEESSFSLYCAYAIDILGEEFQVGALDGIFCTHTHLIPATFDGNLQKALNDAMSEVLGDQGENLKLLIRANYRPSWAAMSSTDATVLWLRTNLPSQADAVIRRANQLFRGLSADRPDACER